MSLRYYRYMMILSAGLAAAACSDETLLWQEGTAGDTGAVTFTAATAVAAVQSRSAAEGTLYEPLELTGADMKLYLHTYDSENIGIDPTAMADTGAESRGVQVEDVSALERYHGDFDVHAMFEDDNSLFFDWIGATPSASGSELWYTRGTYYWPGERMLAFHAVSPASERSRLNGLSLHNNNTVFSYSPCRGTDNRDAESQPDLLLATASCNKSSSIQGRAPLKFHHALSAVKFAVRNVVGGEVVNIKVAGVYGTAECVYSADESGDNGTFSWHSHSGKATYSQNFNYALSDRDVSSDDESADELLNSSMPEKTFMLLPQRIPDDAEIVVTLKRRGMTPETVELRGRIKANNVSEWQAGHEYVYTISTSSSNWIYVLTATGNHNSNNGNHNVDGNMIYGYSPTVNEFDTYGVDAYFKVRSYRYHANNPSHVELLPWRAVNTGSDQTRKDGSVVADRYIAANQWIPTRSVLSGSGSSAAKGERRNISFAPQHIMTDWAGDKWMQDQKPYAGNSEATPWDLSQFSANGGRTTANCYVIDREGWYTLPLVYGNAITDGKTNTAAFYKSGQSSSGGLNRLRDHADAGITNPYIYNKYPIGSAELMWADVFNVITDVKLSDDKKWIKFYANKENMQQGNAVIAVKDPSGTVLWSWHIWINEHWLNPANGKPHAFDKSAAAFNTFTAAIGGSGWRERGDLLLNNDHVGGSANNYWISPYNLGWCDPKNVDYLIRRGTMTFTQYMPDGSTVSGLSCQLPVVQDGDRIEYFYGNNTYYQWGRKDPFIGFRNHDQTTKPDYGANGYTTAAQKRSLGWAIQRPNVLLCTTTASDANANDWTSNSYSNLWNNGSNFASSTATTSVKTIYDPCPPGYKVPVDHALRFIGKANDGSYASDLEESNMKNLNGVEGPVTSFMYKICAINKWKNMTKKTGDQQTDANTIWLTSTGHRWYNDNRFGDLGVKGGWNFNPRIVYLGSCTVVATSGNNAQSARGIALGLDEKNENLSEEDKNAGKYKYIVNPSFVGRKAMARPIRPFRE